MNLHKLEKRIAVAIGIAFVLSLIPLLWISIFDHPCADDFTYGLAAHLAWKETGSVLQTISAAAGKVAERYRNWQGTFSSIFLMAVQPAVFSERAYAFTPFLLLFMLCSSTLAVLRELLTGYLQSTKAQAAIVACTVTAMSVQLLFSPVEAIYWYNGAIHYVFMYSCMLFSITCLINYLRSEKKWRLIMACILAFVVGGGNYITALTAILLELIVVGFMFVYRKLRLMPAVLCGICSIAGLVISGLAPGNSVRQSNFEKLSVAGTVLQAFKDGFLFITSTIEPLYLLMLLLLLPVIVHIVSKTKAVFRLPLLVPLGSYCLISAMFAPTEYTMRVFYVGRTANVVMLMIHLLGVLNEIYLVGYTVQKSKGLAEKLLQWKRTLAWYAVVIALMGCTFLATYKTKYYTSVTALLSWKSGQLAAYDQEIKDRLEILEDSSIEDVELQPLVQQPYLLYFDDITEKKNDWRNKAMARYYGKKSVILK